LICDNGKNRFAFQLVPATARGASRGPEGTIAASSAFSLTNGLHADIREKGNAMLGWALTFLVIALIAAVLGFGGIAGVAVEAAKIVFFVAVILFAISAIAGLMRGRSSTAL
jgi:uncharacterized membrane protein YtjA (UPF0391 family)